MRAKAIIRGGRERGTGEKGRERETERQREGGRWILESITHSLVHSLLKKIFLKRLFLVTRLLSTGYNMS